MNNLNKLLKIISPKEKLHLCMLIFCFIFMGIIEMVGVASILPFMAVVTNPDIIETNHWLNFIFNFLRFSDNQNFLVFLGVVVLVLLVVTNLFKALLTWATLRFDNNLNVKIGCRLLGDYLSRPYEFFLNRNTSDLGKNILSEVRIVVAGVLSPSIAIIAGLLKIFFILVFLLVVNPIVAISIIILLGGSYAIIYFFVRQRLKSIGENQVIANSMKYKFAGEALSGVKDLKVLGREDFFLNVFAKYASRHARNNVAAGSISQLPRFFLEIMAFGGILLIVLHFLRINQDASHMVPLLALYAFAGYRLMPALQELFASFTTLRYSLPSLDVVYHDLSEARIDVNCQSNYAHGAKDPLPFFNLLELRQVSYRYPQAEALALDKVNISIVPNSTVGLVGTTGSGKTTVVDIILGLLTPTSGELVVDEVEVNAANIRQWRLNLGYVPQHIYLSDDTLARNIAFGVSDEDINMEAVFRSAHVANLADFVEQELPQGYDTIIGERGVRLSGGQRQRIGIARALYSDPPVLVMDEATSALDGVTETAVMGAIRSLSGKKTIILIAHRLTTVQDCDIIYQLDHGRIVNQGTYAELQSRSDWFNAASRFET